VLDPVVRVTGGVPGTAQPFKVVREYQGPQGLYVERFTLSDAHGRLLAAPQPGRITLRGEAFEDRFISELRNVTIDDLGEHRLTFYIGDDEVGSVPVFIEPEGGGSARTAAEATFAAAVKKSTIIWVTVPPRPTGRRRRMLPEHTQPVWFVAEGEKVYLLHGPGEQQVPGLGETPTVRLNARGKDTRSLVADVECEVEIVEPDDERWAKIAQKASTRRLNMSDAGDDTIARWREQCQMLELTPQFGADEVAAAAAALPAAQADGAQGSGAAAAATPDRSDEIHVEAQIDQEVMDRLLSEGMPERVARAKSKAHYVRSERARIRAEREGANA
jgi:hypothetical protein